MKELRQTGRTTRMLQEAIAEARLGKYVLVLVDHRNERNRLMLEIGGLFAPGEAEPQESYCIYVNTTTTRGKIVFEAWCDAGDFCWQKMRPRALHPSVVVLVDHHTIEDRFRVMLNMLHRWDEPKAEAG